MICECVNCEVQGNDLLIVLKTDGLDDAPKLQKFVGKEIRVEMEKLDAEYTPNQRKYFHKLVHLLARKWGVSFYACKNTLLANYGKLARLPDGNPIILKINVPPEQAIESSTNHWDFVQYSGGGYFYKILKGTSELNSIEYSELIDGTIYECRTVGIETDTPEELARLKSLWGR